MMSIDKIVAMVLILAGFYEWCDVLARAEDESTGYILPNKVILLIGK